MDQDGVVTEVYRDGGAIRHKNAAQAAYEAVGGTGRAPGTLLGVLEYVAANGLTPSSEENLAVVANYLGTSYTVGVDAIGDVIDQMETNISDVTYRENVNRMREWVSLPNAEQDIITDMAELAEETKQFNALPGTSIYGNLQNEAEKVLGLNAVPAYDASWTLQDYIAVIADGWTLNATITINTTNSVDNTSNARDYIASAMETGLGAFTADAITVDAVQQAAEEDWSIAEILCYCRNFGVNGTAPT